MRLKLKILDLYERNLSVLAIKDRLLKEDSVKFSRTTIYSFLKRHKSCGILTRRRRTVNPASVKLKELHLKFIDLWMDKNNELNASELQKRLFETFGLKVSTSLISTRRHSVLGWKSQTSNKTCQMISRKNKTVRMQWCLDVLQTRERFRDVIFVDESCVEMCANGRIAFHQKSSDFEKKCNRIPRPKHSYKVNVWAGISYKGKTSICIFTGIMDSEIYQKILRDNFVTFTSENFPNGYRLYQDNDSKHTSKSTKAWMEDNGILDHIMKTPASSPDLNPIENVWASMKQYLSNVHKPRTRDELVGGIKAFWASLTAAQCGRYIDHIHRVIPYIVLNKGDASGF